MKYILSGTDRPGSNTLKVATLIQGIYSALGDKTEILDLQAIRPTLEAGPYYGKAPQKLQQFLDKITSSEGLVVVVPEYNGSAPGILKYFIDHMTFPDSFEFRPVCFVGLGGMFGGLRPVEHMQQVFGYRNAFLYPERVFLINVFKEMNAEGKLQNPVHQELLERQARGFHAFVSALQKAGLDANAHLARKPKKN